MRNINNLGGKGGTRLLSNGRQSLKFGFLSLLGHEPNYLSSGLPKGIKNLKKTTKNTTNLEMIKASVFKNPLWLRRPGDSGIYDSRLPPMESPHALMLRAHELRAMFAVVTPYAFFSCIKLNGA